jgi:hypothetical protein
MLPCVTGRNTLASGQKENDLPWNTPVNKQPGSYLRVRFSVFACFYLIRVDCFE